MYKRSRLVASDTGLKTPRTNAGEIYALLAYFALSGVLYAIFDPLRGEVIIAVIAVLAAVFTRRFYISYLESATSNTSIITWLTQDSARHVLPKVVLLVMGPVLGLLALSLIIRMLFQA